MKSEASDGSPLVAPAPTGRILAGRPSDKPFQMVFPHDNVYTRIKPAAHGVGVFAIRSIPKGVKIFSPDPTDMVWLEHHDVDHLPSAIKKLYHDFCVARGTKLGCPISFNAMTPSWYVNHSDKPNVDCNDQLEFIAKRDIAPGEELLVDYRTYSD